MYHIAIIERLKDILTLLNNRYGLMVNNDCQKGNFSPIPNSGFALNHKILS